MALESSSSSIHPTQDNGRLFSTPRSDDYNTLSIEISNFLPFGNIATATDRTTKHLIPPQEDAHGDAFPPSDHPPVSPETVVVDSFPDGGTRSWLVVLGSFFLLMASYGMLNSVGVFQSYLEANQLSSYSSTDVGWIPSIFVFVTLLLGVYIGPLFDSHGPKMLVYVGSAIFMLSLFLFAECKRYWQFLLTFGILGGIGAALVSTVGMACVPHWFEMRAGMAIGTALAGGGLGGAVFPFVLRAGFSNIGFKWTMRTLAFVVGFLCLLGSFMVRARLPRRKTSKVVIDLRCFKDLKFSWMTFSTFCTSHSSNSLDKPVGQATDKRLTGLELQYFSLLGMYPTFITTLGFSTNTSIYLIVIMNICGMIGRLVAGRIADGYGRLNTLNIVVVLTVIWLFALLYPFQTSLPILYIFSCMYGLTSGSFISLAPVCIRQISDAKEIGLRFGTCYSVVSFALLVSIPVTGELMQKGGPKAMIIWSGALLLWTTGLLALTRWTCLSYNWKWKVKV
ncbi:monocarboxylate permease, putative [Talaromyces stipitatus ATCC 10500]|uniref:Monocarboxylate permease, putative n=1 Tax=Talaromyces stipitatus (strain ATCC 10500 / CBS 375.48 / QM 6759 / NRRL 1006) TaxID=441959 RepID=B8MRZ0_TALSN|nr:monocarboxylate permease, putative [Talaromyces stipitatus ATCC 10500]EED13426.1 monocarboxylate permease, putative [Talaromyces stipitatus ATCC 10500]